MSRSATRSTGGKRRSKVCDPPEVWGREPSAAQWRQAFDAVETAICIVGADQIIRVCNRAMRAFLGKPESAIVGGTCCRLVHGTVKPIPDCPVKRLFTSGRRQITITAMGGRWYEVTAEPIRDAGGRLVSALHFMLDVTERHRLEQTLRERDVFLQQLTENIHEVFWLASADQRRMFYVSPAYEKIWGRSCASLLRRPTSWQEAVHPEDRRRVRAEMARDFGKPFRHEYRIVRSDGAVRRILARGFTVPDERGRPFRIAGVAEDITERKRAEDLVRAQRDVAQNLGRVASLSDVLRNCLETALIISGMDCGAIYLRDAKTGAMALNFHAGLSKQFVRSAKFYAADSPNTRLVMAARPVYGRHHALPVSLKATERREAVRALAVIPLRYETQIIGCLNVGSHAVDEIPPSARESLETIALNIGAAIVHAQREDALRKSEERYRTMVETQQELVCRWLPDMTLTFVNRRYCQWFDRPREALLGRKWIDLIPESLRKKALNHFQDLAAKPRVDTYEYETMGPDGARYWREWISAPVLDDQGRFVEFQSVGRDITQRKAAEEEARQFSRQLLKAGEEERKRLAGILHHEVGSMAIGLDARFGYVEQALGRHDIAAALASLKDSRNLLEQSVERLKRLGFDMRPPNLDLLGLEAAAREYLADVGRHTPARVHFHSDLGSEKMPGESGTVLFRVLQEAVTNAIRHSKARNIRIRLATTAAGWLLRIHDDGRGFTPGTLPKLSRAHMGMQASKGMVESQGGIFQVRSKPGQGATVEARLPFRAEEAGR